MPSIRVHLAFFLLIMGIAAVAQTAPPQHTLRGTVLDPSSAVISAASVIVTTPDGRQVAAASTDPTGAFSFSNLPAGPCILTAAKPGFRDVRQPLKLGSSAHAPLRIVLPVAPVAENVTVEAGDTSALISTSVAQNQSGNTVDTAALDRLPVFNQDYLGTMSRFLDPDSTGTNGAPLVVNGVEANGPGVTASAIQSVTINQNPYTALYSRPGRARIEITTKGGTPQFHGSAHFLYRNSVFDATNAFAITKAPEQRTYYEGSLTGPLGPSAKKTTFLLALDKDNDDQEAIVLAAGPDGDIHANVPNPTHHYFLSGRVFHDYGQGNQFWAGYSYEHETVRNEGVGGTVLPEAGTNNLFFEHEVNVGHIYVFSPRLVNQLHFLVGHYDNQVHSISENPRIVVSGAFTGGGAQADSRRTEYHFDGTDIVTWTSGKQEIKAGVDVPDISRRGFDDFTNQAGTYSFDSLADYTAALPFSYLVQSGNGRVTFLEKTYALIFEDNIRLRKNFSIAAGVRYYFQNYFHDIKHNVAPRFSFAFAPSDKSKNVIRGGAGFFFDRTGPRPISDLLRYDGVRLKQFIVDSPSYPVTDAQLAATPTGVVVLDPRQIIPYHLQYGIGIERQLTLKSSVFANYVGARGIRRFRSIDANAPPPPLYAARPNPNLGQEREIQSEGYLKSNALEIGFRGRPVSFFTGQARYNLGKTYNNSADITSFPANSYDPNADWSRSNHDQRHKFDLLATLEARKWFNFGTALSAYSGMPVNITTGNDDNHDGLPIDRPAGVPRNAMHGPGYLELDVNLSQDFPLTSKGDKGPVASLALNSFNVLNHPNDMTYIGVVGSPFFGQAVAAQPPRRMQLDLEFRF